MFPTWRFFRVTKILIWLRNFGRHCQCVLQFRYAGVIENTPHWAIGLNWVLSHLVNNSISLKLAISSFIFGDQIKNKDKVKILYLNLSRKQCRCYSLTFLNHTPKFDWCVVRWGSENKHEWHRFERDLNTSTNFIVYSMLNLSAHIMDLLKEPINMHFW